MDKQKRWILLGGIAVCLVGAFFVSKCADDEGLELDPEKKKRALAREQAEGIDVKYPRDTFRPRKDSPLATKRPELATLIDEDDPVLRAMSTNGGGAVFIEVNAIRHSPLVEKVLRCRDGEAMAGFDDLKKAIGVDVLEDVDRLAIGDEGIAISGFFENFKVPEDLGAPETHEGNDIYAYTSDEGSKPGYFAQVGDGLIVAGEDKDALARAIDRVEGRTSSTPIVPIKSTNSEIYGRVSSDFLGKFLQNDKDPLAMQVRELVTGGTVRLNVDEHVSASFDVDTNDGAKGKDLAKALGGALAVMRRDAEKQGDAELAALLEKARIMPNDNGSFALDMAVPGDTLLEMLGCNEK